MEKIDSSSRTPRKLHKMGSDNRSYSLAPWQPEKDLARRPSTANGNQTFAADVQTSAANV